MPENWHDSLGRISWSKIRAALKSSKWCLDWWEGDPRPDKTWDEVAVGLGHLHRAYYIRPVIKGWEGNVLAPEETGSSMFSFFGAMPGISGECTFLGNKGCSLKRKQIPTMCKALKPNKRNHKNCKHDLPKGIENSRQYAALQWIPYSDKLREIAMEIL